MVIGLILSKQVIMDRMHYYYKYIDRILSFSLPWRVFVKWTKWVFNWVFNVIPFQVHSADMTVPKSYLFL